MEKKKEKVVQTIDTRVLRLIYPNKIGFDIMEHATFGDFFIASLVSGKNSRQMHQVMRDRAYTRYLLKRSTQKLVNTGFLRVKKGTEDVFQITSHGRSMMQLMHAKQRSLHKLSLLKETWDGKWRLITFDFTSAQRSKVDSLRYLLKKFEWFQI